MLKPGLKVAICGRECCYYSQINLSYVYSQIKCITQSDEYAVSREMGVEIAHYLGSLLSHGLSHDVLSYACECVLQCDLLEMLHKDVRPTKKKECRTPLHLCSQ